MAGTLTLPAIVVPVEPQPITSKLLRDGKGAGSPGSKGSEIRSLPKISLSRASNVSSQNVANQRAKSRNQLLDPSRGEKSFLVGSSSRIAPDEAKMAERRHTKSNIRKAKNGGKTEKVDDELNYEHLKELEKIFEDAKSEGADGLSMEQFRVAMKKTMGEHIDDRQLDLMFMKVDNNCDGTVDWDEYLSYMLLEYQEKENMISSEMDKPFPHPLVEKSCNHIESICRISLLQATSSRACNAESDHSSSRYLSLSKEGVLNVWNMEWKLQKSLTLTTSKMNTKSGYFTDLVCMANCNSFAVASADYEISFYAITSNLIQKKFQIYGLHCCALTMDYSFSHRYPQKSTLLWGDTGGNIFILRMYDNPAVALFPHSKLLLSSMLRTSFSNMKLYRLPMVHRDWVQQIRYFTNKKDQEYFLSCCLTDETSLVYADITENNKPQKGYNRLSKFHTNKGIMCCTYETDWNLIITGSRDCDVRVWNAFITKRSLAILKGHHAAITQVLLRKLDHHVVSISKDNNIRIWDLRYYSCKQNINSKHVPMGRLSITAAFFYEQHKEMVVATNRIGIFFCKGPANAKASNRQPVSHQKPVSRVLHNRLFDQIVTGGQDSMICIWDMNTGKKTMQFCAEKGVEITSMTFDPTWRRLATGLRNGATKLWNFNNGACLRTFAKPDGLEISDIIFSKQRIVTAGWSKHPVFYMDSQTENTPYPLNRKHGDDIMSLDYYKADSVLASSSYDGDIYLWSLESQGLIVAFNMHRSLLPLHIGGNRKNRESVPNSVAEVTSNTGSSSSGSVAESIANKVESKERASQTTTNRESKTKYSREKRKQKTPAKKSKTHGMDHEHRAEFTASGTEISPADIYLPTSLPWLKHNQRKAASKQVRFSEHSSEEENSADEPEEVAQKFEITDKAVYKVLFLQTRRNHEDTAVLLASNAMGWLTAWSVHPRGGLLGYFRATKQETEMVTTMESDSEDHILITGDSRGYIKVWYIEEYCNAADVIAERQRQDAAKGVGCTKDKYHHETEHYMPISIAPPMQLSIRGHTKAVTSIAFIERHALIATGSVDCSVRLWTLCGRYVGTFGQKDPWNLQLPVKPNTLPSNIPEDIRRVGSTTTLKTVKGGYHTQWKQVKHAVTFFAKAGKAFNFDKPAEDAEGEVRRGSIKDRLNAIERDILEESMAKPSARRKSVTVWLDDTPHAITVARKPADKAETSFLRLETDGFTSSVLGKLNYKPKKRHRESKICKEIRWSNKQAVVYGALPCFPLSRPLEPTLPDFMRTYHDMRRPETPRTISPIPARLRVAGHLSRRSSTRRGHTVEEKQSTRLGRQESSSGQPPESGKRKHTLPRLPLLALPAASKKAGTKGKNAPFALPGIAT